ncbi:MAG: O-antigen ligase family protein, partial [Saprospiraceae bacterium]
LVLLELGNPEMVSGMAWFYAMRAVGFYQMLVLGLVYLFVNDKSFLDKFLKVISWLSVAGTIWGLKQMIIGTDAAEEYWLFVEGYADTHVLVGVLRVFSFYSDAGQFGASQAQLALMAGIIAIGPGKWSTRLFYVFIALITFVGFGISGTRGALAVPAGGAIAYLVVSRNFKLLIAGILAMGISFYFLKYTYALQGVEQVRRMRTALNVDDPSLQVRLQNQIKFGNYLASRPFGGGIGSAGYWGYRFSPHTFLANTATDSYYVKIWAETGIIGISLHLAMFGFFLGKGGVIIWHLRDPILRQKIIALYSGVVGILLSSYGNQVFSQMPTGIIMYISIPLIFISPKFDNLPPKNED